MEAKIYFFYHGVSEPSIIEYKEVETECQFTNMMVMAMCIGNEDGKVADKTMGYYDGVWYHAVGSE